MNLLLGLLLLGLQEAAQPPAPVTINNPDPKFRMTVPRGYQDPGVRPPKVSYSYQRVLPDGKALALNVEILNGRIDRAPMSEAEVRAAALKQLPAGAEFRLGKAAWGELELDVMESTFVSSGTELFAAVVQIPTVPRAVQLSFAGQKASEAEIREDLRRVLATFKGSTDWLTPRQKWLAGLSGGFLILPWLLLIVYGLLYAGLYRKQPLRAWKFRVAYLTVDVLLFGIALLLHVLYQASKGRPPIDTTFYVIVGVAAFCTVRTTQLAQRGRAAQAAPIVSPPAP